MAFKVYSWPYPNYRLIYHHPHTPISPYKKDKEEINHAFFFVFVFVFFYKYAYGSEMPSANSSNKTKPVMKTKKTELAKILKMTTGLIFVLIPITIATINPISIKK